MHPWEKNHHQWLIEFHLSQLDEEGAGGIRKKWNREGNKVRYRQKTKTQKIRNEREKEERVGGKGHPTCQCFFPGFPDPTGASVQALWKLLNHPSVMSLATTLSSHVLQSLFMVTKKSLEVRVQSPNYLFLCSQRPGLSLAARWDIF